MSVIDEDGNIVSLIQSNFSWFGSGLVAPRHRSLHTIIPAFMEKDGTRIGFGQAVESTPDGVHHGASDPRHDGAAIPQPAPFGAP